MTKEDSSEDKNQTVLATSSTLPTRPRGILAFHTAPATGSDSIASFDWVGITDGPSLVSPLEFPNTVINAPAGQAAIKHKLRGVNSTICCGLSSGLYAIDYAAEFLRRVRSK